jgi:hypothetical protein
MRLRKIWSIFNSKHLTTHKSGVWN